MRVHQMCLIAQIVAAETDTSRKMEYQKQKDGTFLFRFLMFGWNSLACTGIHKQRLCFDPINKNGHPRADIPTDSNRQETNSVTRLTKLKRKSVGI